MKANNLFISLASDNVSKFMENIRKVMIKEAIVAMRTNFNARILSRGAEKLFSEIEITDGLKEYFGTPLGKLLKDNLPIENWKSRLANAAEDEELKIVKEIVKVIDKYPGWQSDKKEDKESAVKYALSMQEMNCVMRSILLSRIFKGIGIEENRLRMALFPNHICLIMRLRNGDYLKIETTRTAFKDTEILPQEIKAGLDEAFKQARVFGSARMWFCEGPKNTMIYRTFSITNNTEGLIEGLYNNLGGYFPFTGTESKRRDSGAIMLSAAQEEQAIRLFKMRCALFQELTNINPNNASGFHNWGSSLSEFAMMRKAADAEEATSYLTEACAKYKKTIAIDPNHADAFNRWGMALYELAMIEKSVNPEKAIDYLDKACAKYEAAIDIKPTDVYFDGWSKASDSFTVMKEKAIDSAERTNQLNKRCAKCKELIDVDPNNAMVFYKWGIALGDLGIIGKKTGDPAKAAEYLSQAIEKLKEVLRIFPQSSEAQKYLDILMCAKEAFEQNIFCNAARSSL